MLTLKQAAEHVHLDENELRHCAQRGEVEAVSRGGDWYFDYRSLDEWAQRALLASSRKALDAVHRTILDENRRAAKEGWGVASLLGPDAIALDVAAKAKAGLIRDMTDLAERTGLVYDPEALFRELVAREEIASTAIGAGVAFLHPRFHDPYLFQETFVAYGRTERPVFFGAPDGAGTRHFFLICSTDHELHLHILARLAVLAHGSALVESLDAAADADAVIAAVRACEKDYVR